MALYVIPVPQPAAGHDWLYKIPGQYLEHITAVAATLVTGLAPTTIPDETGNGHDMTVIAASGYTFGATGPYAGGASNYGMAHVTAAGSNGPGAVAANSALFGSAALTVDGWFYSNDLFGSGFSQGDLWGIFTSPNGQEFSVYANAAAGGVVDLGFQSAGSGTTVRSAFMSTGAWHHVALVFSSPNWSVYLDGVFVFSTASHPPLGRGSNQGFVCPGDDGLGRWAGRAAGIAYYSAALSGAQIAAHAAASGSWTAYRTAVLADTPGAFWGLNNSPGGPARTVLLEVTDGTHVVQDIPSGLTPTLPQVAYQYSWQTNLASNVQAGSGSVTTVGIPDLILPPGYTIGTNTLDLAGTDQWSEINVWWNSDVQDSHSPGGQFNYGDGAFLVYERVP